MVLLWYWCGTILVLVWYYSGTGMVVVWYYSGTDLVLLWYWFGTTLVLIWYYSGTGVVLLWYWCWYYSGTGLVRTPQHTKVSTQDIKGGGWVWVGVVWWGDICGVCCRSQPFTRNPMPVACSLVCSY